MLCGGHFVVYLQMMNPSVPDSLVQDIQRKLLAWAQTALRDLPWRQHRTPYSVWVSEIMLQQTRVETVIPYYERWMERFPTVETLTQANLDQVLKLWEGLGYYARCRNLYRAAQIVASRFHGQLPESRQELAKLPGVGPYTVGAILSIAFGQDAAVLDGNVRRVLSRLFALPDDPRAADTRRKLWALSEELLPAGRAGPFNEALMDLGATVCTPKPRCMLCPLNQLCRAYEEGEPERYPPRARRQRVPHYSVTAGVIWRDGQLLLAQRPLDGLLGGLWEFPGGKQEPGETLAECLKRELREELAIQVQVGKQLATIRHAFTHFRITVYAFECQYDSDGEPQAIGVHDWRWVSPDDLDSFAFPVVDQKIIQVLRQPWEQAPLNLHS
jgi:A/G-specific adenine glycosylase